MKGENVECHECGSTAHHLQWASRLGDILTAECIDCGETVAYLRTGWR